MSDCCRNGRAHGVHQRVRKRVELLLSHDLIVHLQSCQEDPQGALCSGGESHVFPTLLLWDDLALQLLHQVVVNGSSYYLWGYIPDLAHTDLPDIGIESS